MPTVYSPPVSTYVALATTTLPSATATVTFSSIPATYRDLVLVIDGQQSNSGGSEVVMQINGDGSSSYTNVRMNGNGTNTSSASYTETFITLAQATRGVRFTTVTSIMDYSATDKHKTVLSRGNQGGGGDGVGAIAGRWPSTSAVTSIAAKNYFGENFDAGTTFSLYGIEA